MRTLRLGWLGTVLASAALAVVLAAIAKSHRAMAQASKPAAPALLQDLRSVRTVVPTPDGGFAVVGTARQSAARQGPMIQVHDPFGKLARTIAITPPSGSAASELRVESAILLDTGDLVVVGWIDIRANTTRPLEGWAARVSAGGETRWSRSWPDGRNSQLHEQLYFVRRLDAEELIVGGKSQVGRDPCQGDSNGVLLRLRLSNGDAIGTRAFLRATGKTRQGLRDGQIETDGALTLVGWSNDGSTAPGQPCPDDVWLARYKLGAPAPLTSESRIRTGGHSVPFSITRIDGIPRAFGVRRDGAAPTGSEFGLAIGMMDHGSVDPIDLDTFRPEGSSSARLTFASASTTANSNGEVLAGGFATIQGRTVGWTRWLDQSGRCAGEVLSALPGGSVEGFRTTGAARFAGGLAIAGEARSSTEPGGSIGWLHIVPIEFGSLRIGSLDAGGAHVTRILSAPPAAAPPPTIDFDVPRAARLVVAARPIGSQGHWEMALFAGGRLLDLASAGTHTIDRRLEPGSYSLRFIATKASGGLVTVSIAASEPTSPPPESWTVAQYNSGLDVERALLHRELSTLGVWSGREPNVALGWSASASIRNYQASRCDQMTGALTEAQRRRLALDAALADVAKASRAVSAWQRLEDEPRTTEIPLVERDLSRGTFRFATHNGQQIGSITVAGQSLYTGELQIPPDEANRSAMSLADAQRTITGHGHRTVGNVWGRFSAGIVADYALVSLAPAGRFLGRVAHLPSGIGIRLGQINSPAQSAVSVNQPHDETCGRAPSARPAGVLLGCAPN